MSAFPLRVVKNVRQAKKASSAEHAELDDNAVLTKILRQATHNARSQLRTQREGSVPQSAVSKDGQAPLRNTLKTKNISLDFSSQASEEKENSLQEKASSPAEAEALEQSKTLPNPPNAFLRGLGAFIRLCFALCCATLLVLAVYFGSIHLYKWCTTSPLFIARHVDITGNVRMSREMILRIGGLQEGINTFSVSVAMVEDRLRETPWVEDVSVTRVLPDRFVIRVSERMPSFWVQRHERLYYANLRGEAIAPVESENFISLPLLHIEPGCEEAIPYLARLMADMRSGVLPVETGAIASIEVTPSKGVELYLEDREMHLSLAPDDWEGNLVRLGHTIGDLARRRELSSVQEIRAAAGSVWVVLRPQAR